MTGDKGEEITDWRELEKRVAKLYRQLRCKSKRSVRIKGARAAHNVDVLVVCRFGDHKFVIIVDCKNWKLKVPKEKVATLKSIVEDVGADKGIIVSQKGFQKGAIQLSEKTNIDLLTWPKLKQRTTKAIEQFKYHTCVDRIQKLKDILEEHSNEMQSRAERAGTLWYGAKEFQNLQSSLILLKDRVDNAMNLKFPRGFGIYSPGMDDLEVRKAQNLSQALDYALENVQSLEEYFRTHRDKILLDEWP